MSLLFNLARSGCLASLPSSQDTVRSEGHPRSERDLYDEIDSQDVMRAQSDRRALGLLPQDSNTQGRYASQ